MCFHNNNCVQFINTLGLGCPTASSGCSYNYNIEEVKVIRLYITPNQNVTKSSFIIMLMTGYNEDASIIYMNLQLKQVTYKINHDSFSLGYIQTSRTPVPQLAPPALFRASMKFSISNSAMFSSCNSTAKFWKGKFYIKQLKTFQFRLTVSTFFITLLSVDIFARCMTLTPGPTHVTNKNF